MHYLLITKAAQYLLLIADTYLLIFSKVQGIPKATPESNGYSNCTYTLSTKSLRKNNNKMSYIN